MEVTDVKAAREYVMGNYPNDPLLKHIAVSLLEQLPKVEAVEVIHGRWAALDDDCEEVEDQEEAIRWGCSACHEIVEYDDWTHRSRKVMNG